MDNISEIATNCNCSHDDHGYCDNFGDYMRAYVLPGIISIGLCGNFLAALTFFFSILKKRSSSIYLAYLSITDFLYLLLLLIINYDVELDLYNRLEFCKLFTYLSAVFSLLSVWLIVAFTIERFIAVKFPLHRPQICTTRRAKIISFFIIAVAFLSQIHIIWIAGINDELCDLLPESKNFMNIYNYFDTIIALIIPLMIIVILNALIIKYMWNFKEKSYFGRGLSCETPSTSGESSLRVCKTNKATSRNTNVLLMTRSQRNITQMLLLTSAMFLILNVPSYVLRLYMFTLKEVLKQPITQTMECFQQIAMMLFYVNYSVNFILYSMCGATFRQAFYNLLRKYLNKLKTN